MGLETIGPCLDTNNNNERKTMNTAQQYSGTADELTSRILALIPDNPGILEIDGPWDLFEVQGFKCNDINPSLFQASWALARAKKIFREQLTKGDQCDTKSE